jgi:hypothetical protein
LSRSLELLSTMAGLEKRGTPVGGGPWVVGIDEEVGMHRGAQAKPFTLSAGSEVVRGSEVLVAKEMADVGFGILQGVTTWLVDEGLGDGVAWAHRDGGA